MCFGLLDVTWRTQSKSSRCVPIIPSWAISVVLLFLKACKCWRFLCMNVEGIHRCVEAPMGSLSLTHGWFAEHGEFIKVLLTNVVFSM